jgi:hypothetical protein
MINNTRLSHRASIHIQPTYVSWEHGTQSLSALTPDYHPLGYHTRFTHTSPPSSTAPRGAAWAWRNVAQDVKPYQWLVWLYGLEKWLLQLGVLCLPLI